MAVNLTLSENAGGAGDITVVVERYSGLFMAVVFLVSFLLYLNALPNGFVYDDLYTIVENPYIKDTEHMPEMFLTNVWSFQGRQTAHYRPMMHLIFMADYHIFGLTAWGFHLSNIMLHSLNSLMVYLIAAVLLKRKIAGARSPLPAFIAAVLFAAHPMQTEAVTFISDVTDVSFSFFYLLGFYLYIKEKTYLSAFAFFLSALCKETAMTFPLMLIAYDYAFKRPSSLSGLFRRYLPFVIAGGAYLALRLNALGGLAPVGGDMKLSAWQHFINAFPLFMQYLGKLLLPISHNVFYVFHPVKSILELKTIFSLLGACAFIASIYLLRKRNPLAAFSLILIVIPLLLAFYIPGMSENVFAERRLYLSTMGFTMLLAMGLKRLSLAAERINRRASVFAMVIPFVVISAIYSYGTLKRNPVWKDNITLWTDIVKKSPEGYVPHMNMGLAYEEAGQYDNAISEYKTALEIAPDRAGTYNNLGKVYYLKGMFMEAVNLYKQALAIKPDSHRVHYNLALAFVKTGDIDGAIREYEAALKLKPDFAKARNNLGNALYWKGRIDEAIAQFNTAIGLNPDYAKAHRNISIAYTAKGLSKEAQEHSEIAERLEKQGIPQGPDYSDLSSP